MSIGGVTQWANGTNASRASPWPLAACFNHRGNCGDWRQIGAVAGEAFAIGVSGQRENSPCAVRATRTRPPRTAACRGRLKRERVRAIDARHL